MEQFSRFEMLIGHEKCILLQNKCVAIFGLGGVGSAACEALARSGIYHFILVDNDVVSLSNLNRQIIATLSTLDKPKVEVMKERILDINSTAEIITYQDFILKDNLAKIDLTKVDYIIDCVDTISTKIALIKYAKEKNIAIISCLGVGNKLDPLALRVSDIYQTSMCPLAKVLRHELRKRNIKDLKVVYSLEKPVEAKKIINEKNNKVIPGSSCFVPPVAGIIIASVVVKDVLK